MNDLDIIKSLSAVQANAILSKVVEIHNDLITDKKECGWVKMGMFIERLSARIREASQTPEQPPQQPLPPPGADA